jgi:D-alanine-D-alanine ligase
MTRRILVIGGGENAEHDVSLATATAVAEALRSNGFDVDELTIDRDGMWRRGADALGSQTTSSLAAALVLRQPSLA